MNKPVKYLALAFALLFALLAAVLIYAKLFVDPNDYREQIASQASKATGREIVIAGDLSLSVFPWLGIEIGKVSIGNAPGFSGEFASIDNAGAAVRLLPLLSKNIEIDRIVLDGLNANMQVARNGRNNWSDIGQTDQQPQVQQPETQQSVANSSSEAAGLKSFSIEGISINNGHINYTDAQSGQHIEVSDIGLQASGITSGKPFALQGGLLLQIPADQISYKIDLDGELRYQADAGQLDFNGLQLTLADQSTAALPAFKLEASGALNTNAETLNLDPLQLTVGDLRLDAQLQGSGIMSAAAINGSMQVAEFNPAKLARAFAVDLPELNSDKALKTASAELKLNATKNRVQVSNLRILLDESTINGNLSAMLGAQRNAFVFDLNLDQINLDNYMPATPAAGSEPMPPVDVEMFRAFDARGKIKADQLTINKLDATDINVAVTADRNGWSFQPITANFYAGRLDGGIAIDARGDSPVLSTNGNLNEVLTGAMLADVTGRDLLSGIAKFDNDLKMDINNPQQTLTGEFSLDISDGELKGVDIASMLRQGLSIANSLTGGRVGGESLLKSSGNTDFASLSGHFIANNGVIRNNDLQLLSPLLNVLGEGVIDLASDKIDYTMTASLLQAPQDGSDSTLGNMLGKQIPIHIGGTLARPRYSIDPQALMKMIAGDKLDARKGKLLDKLRGDEADPDSSRSSAAGVLGGLLGGGKSGQDESSDQQPSADSAAAQDADADTAASATEGQQQDSDTSTEAAAGALLKGLFKKKKPAEEPPPPDDDDDGA